MNKKPTNAYELAQAYNEKRGIIEEFKRAEDMLSSIGMSLPAMIINDHLAILEQEFRELVAQMEQIDVRGRIA